MSIVVRYDVVGFSMSGCRNVVAENKTIDQAVELCLILNARDADMPVMHAIVPEEHVVLVCTPGEQLGARSYARVWTDGACLGNPGQCGSGVVIEDTYDGQRNAFSVWTGNGTNNESEYRALITALENCNDIGFDELNVYSDSKLLVEQMKGNYKVSAPTIAPLHARATELLQFFDNVTFNWIPREANSEADALASTAAARGHN